MAFFDGSGTLWPVHLHLLCTQQGIERKHTLEFYAFTGTFGLGVMIRPLRGTVKEGITKRFNLF